MNSGDPQRFASVLYSLVHLSAAPRGRVKATLQSLRRKQTAAYGERTVVLTLACPSGTALTRITVPAHPPLPSALPQIDPSKLAEEEKEDKDNLLGNIEKAVFETRGLRVRADASQLWMHAENWTCGVYMLRGGEP